MNDSGLEIWKLLLGIGGLMIPIAMIAFARDRSLQAMISTVKDDANSQIKASTDPIHERINRVRDEFVRRDDLEGHLQRWDRQFAEIRDDMRRNNDAIGKRLDEIMARLSAK